MTYRNKISVKYLQSLVKLIQGTGLGCPFSSDCNSSDHETITTLSVNYFPLPWRVQALLAQGKTQIINISVTYYLLSHNG